MTEDLDAALMDAHARRDHAALVTLYRSAADQAGSACARTFFLTQAYVFALEAGRPEADDLRDALAGLGSE